MPPLIFIYLFIFLTYNHKCTNSHIPLFAVSLPEPPWGVWPGFEPETTFQHPSIVLLNFSCQDRRGEKSESGIPTHWDRYPRVTSDRENWKLRWKTSIEYESGKCTLAVQGGILGGHKSAPLSHKHMLSQQSFSFTLINEDLPAGPQLMFTLNNRFRDTK